jgi:hypothetical protein
MVQGVGRLQVAKCTQGDIFNSTDEAPASSRHDGIMTVASLNSRALLLLAWFRAVASAAGVGSEYSHSTVRYYYITDEPLDAFSLSSFL